MPGKGADEVERRRSNSKKKYLNRAEARKKKHEFLKKERQKRCEVVLRPDLSNKFAGVYLMGKKVKGVEIAKCSEGELTREDGWEMKTKKCRPRNSIVHDEPSSCRGKVGKLGGKGDDIMKGRGHSVSLWSGGECADDQNKISQGREGKT